MFLPIGDEPNEPGIPWVTYGLIAINVLVYAVMCWPLTNQTPDPNDPLLLAYTQAMSHELGLAPNTLARHTSAYDLFIFAHGFRPNAPHLSTLMTGMFLHGGWMHLLGNMLFLGIFGDNVEVRFGRVPYLILYLATGALGTLFFAAFSLNSSVPLVGASGAISGVLGCYFVWFPRHRVRVLMVLIIFVDVILVPARWVLGFYLVVENFLPFMMESEVGGVAHGAHIGGFLTGAGFAMAVKRWWGSPGWCRDLPPPVAPTPASRFRTALITHDFVAALQMYADMPMRDRHGLGAEEIFVLADGLTEGERYASALAVLQRFVALAPTHPKLPHAHLRMGLLHWRGLHQPQAAYQHFLMVLDMPAPAEVTDTARRALAEMERT